MRSSTPRCTDCPAPSDAAKSPHRALGPIHPSIPPQQNVQQYNATIGVLFSALRMISKQNDDRDQEVQQVERLGAKQAFVVSHVGADEAKHAVVEQSVDLIGGHPRKQQLEGLQHHSTIHQRSASAKYPPRSADIDNTCVVMASHHFRSGSSQFSSNCCK